MRSLAIAALLGCGFVEVALAHPHDTESDRAFHHPSDGYDHTIGMTPSNQQPLPITDKADKETSSLILTLWQSNRKYSLAGLLILGFLVRRLVK